MLIASFIMCSLNLCCIVGKMITIAYDISFTLSPRQCEAEQCNAKQSTQKQFKAKRKCFLVKPLPSQAFQSKTMQSKMTNILPCEACYLEARLPKNKHKLLHVTTCPNHHQDDPLRLSKMEKTWEPYRYHCEQISTRAAQQST